MKVAEHNINNNLSVKDLIQKFDNTSRSASDITSPVMKNIAKAVNTHDTLIPAGHSLIEKKEVLQQIDTLPQKFTPSAFTQNESFRGVDVLCETYRRCALPPEEIKSLCQTCSDIKNYIVNSEKQNIITEKPSHNTAAALAACEELKKYSIGLPHVKILGVAGNAESRRNLFLVDGENIRALYQLAGSDTSSRTLSMLSDAGILDKIRFVQEFKSLDEDVIKDQLIERLSNFYESEGIDTSIVNIKKSVDEAFLTLKSDSFIQEWLRSGYSTENEHRNCISKLGKYINFQYSDLFNRDLEHFNFSDMNLVGSSFDNCALYKCDFTDASLSEVTMYNTRITDCNNSRDRDYFIAQDLIESGVEGICLSDYYDSSSDED